MNKEMRLIDADALVGVFEEYDMYLWGLPKKENPHRDAFRSQLNWCINKTRERPTIFQINVDIEKVNKGLLCCSIGECPGKECPYWHNVLDDAIKRCDCTTELIRDIRDILDR